MDFPMFLNKFTIGNRYLRHYPIYWWYRLMSHSEFRFDDYHVWKEFWHSLNAGWKEKRGYTDGYSMGFDDALNLVRKTLK